MATPIVRSRKEGEKGSLAASGPLSDHYGPRQERDWIGKRVPRVDGPAKVSGGATYTMDVHLPNMLYAAVLRAPHASAQVLNIDTSVAAGMPGVQGILTFNDKRIRFAGSEVAAVCANTLDQAKDAVRAIKVEYEVFDAVVTTDDAMAPGAPQVYETKPNVGNASVREEGDVQAGFAEADVVLEMDYRTSVQTHSPMEPHCAVVYWESGSRIVAYVSTQGVSGTAGDLADYFGLDTENVRVYCDYIGGGFGSKVGAGLVTTMAAELAQMTGRPVKLWYDRKGEQLAAGNRPDSIQHFKIGAKRDGTVTALEVTGYATPGIGSGAGFATPARDLYTIPNYRTSETAVYTNCGTAMTMRAPGHPQGAYAIEQAMDELAYALSMDPIELRLANNSYRLRAKQFEKGAETFGWSNRNTIPGSGTGRFKTGMGVASCTWTNGGYPGVTVRLTVGTNGSILVQNNATDIGTGTRTWMAMLVAEQLGLSPADITIQMGDSALPLGPTAAGSTTTPTLSPVTRDAADQAKARIAEAVAPVLGCAAEDVLFEDGSVSAPSGNSMPFAEACQLLGGPVTVEGTRSDDARIGSDTVMGVQFAEVEVDTLTGQVRVKRILAIHNAGRILNLLTAESQVIGGVIGGLNYALHEERVMDRNLGIMLNANLEGYKIGVAKDIPAIEVMVQDLSSGGTYVGALGLGEAPTIPTSGAIANAVFNAIGVRVRTIPITPARVLEALGTISAGKSTRRVRKGGLR